MSIFTDMYPVTLMINKPREGLSGENIDNYAFLQNIDAAIYENNAFTNFSTVKYKESTHNAITFCKDFVDGKEYQIIVGISKYIVTYFDTSGRFTLLLLKKLDFNE